MIEHFCDAKKRTLEFIGKCPWCNMEEVTDDWFEDKVNKPAHYQGKVECIDAIESAVEGLEGLEAVCTANVIKYVWRWKKKNGKEDLAKASWYINKLLNNLK